MTDQAEPLPTAPPKTSLLVFKPSDFSTDNNLTYPAPVVAGNIQNI